MNCSFNPYLQSSAMTQLLWSWTYNFRKLTRYWKTLRDGSCAFIPITMRIIQAYSTFLYFWEESWEPGHTHEIKMSRPPPSLPWTNAASFPDNQERRWTTAWNMRIDSLQAIYEKAYLHGPQYTAWLLKWDEGWYLYICIAPGSPVIIWLHPTHF